MISLRNRLSPERRKLAFRLDAFDLAAAALALPVTREKRLWEQGSEVDKQRLRKLSDPPEDDIATLSKKLENARKRAKPSPRHSSRPQYEERAKIWRDFVAWIRYHRFSNHIRVPRKASQWSDCYKNAVPASCGNRS